MIICHLLKKNYNKKKKRTIPHESDINNAPNKN